MTAAQCSARGAQGGGDTLEEKGREVVGEHRHRRRGADLRHPVREFSPYQPRLGETFR
jgi:hypothetical protein